MNQDNNKKREKHVRKGIFVFTGSAGGGGAERVANDVYSNLPACLRKRITIYDDGDDMSYSIPDLTLGFKHSKHFPEYLTYLWKLPIGILKYSRYLKKYQIKPLLFWVCNNNVL